MKYYILVIMAFILSIGLKPSDCFGQINKNELAFGLGFTSGNLHPIYYLPERDAGIHAAMLYAEYGVSNFFSLGPYFLYSREVATYESIVYPALNSKDISSGFDAGVRGSFHTNSFLPIKPNMDIYLTGFYGYTYRSAVYDKKNIYRDDFNTKVDATYYGGLIGLSYNFLPNFGMYGEAGYSNKFFLGAGLRFILTKKEQ